MLSYLYRFTYAIPSDDSCSAIVFHTRVHTIADKYSIPDLVNLAFGEFAKYASEQWNTNGFAEAVKEIYTCAADLDHSLRKKVVSIACAHAAALFKEDDAIAFRLMSAAVPTFATELSAMLAGITERLGNELLALHGKTTYQCMSCKAVFRCNELSSGSFRCPGCNYNLTHDHWNNRKITLREL